MLAETAEGRGSNLDFELVRRLLKVRSRPWVLELDAVRERLNMGFMTEYSGEYRDFVVPIPGQRDSIGVREYAARPSSPSEPTVVFVHGGGWVGNGLNTHDSLCHEIARLTGRCVWAIDYSLSPEAKYPTAIDQIVAVVKHHVLLGLSTQVILVGESAGATLVLGASIRLRAQGFAGYVEEALLAYPMVDAQINWGSYTSNASYCGITVELVRWFWQQYLPEDFDASDEELWPLRGALGSLPPSTIAVGEYDILRDECMALVEALKRSGNEVREVLFPDANHGVLRLAGRLDVSDRALQMFLGPLAISPHSPKKESN